MAKKLSREEQQRTRADFDAPKKKGGKGNPNGRPQSIEPRLKMVAFKLSAAERERLDEAARILDATKTKVVVEGIDLVYSRALKEERRRNSMTETQARRKLKEAGYSLRKERGGDGYMIIQKDINSVVGGSDYSFALADVETFIKQYC